MVKFGMGQSVRRVEDPRLLTGQGRYTADIDLDGQAYAHVLRSPMAHARIRSIDTAAAAAAPGVLKVYTAEDIKAAGLGTIPCRFPLKQANGDPMVAPPHPILADGAVRHVGDPVAFIVAETLEQARDAAELVEIDYDLLPAIVETDKARAPDAPQIWPEAAHNTCFHWENGDKAAVDAAFAKAAHVVKRRLINNRLVVNPMEPRAAIGDWDGKRMSLYTPTQGVHSIRDQLVKNIFKVGNDDVAVYTTDVGGGFGMKIFLYGEQPLVMLAARDLNRPVKWVGDRAADDFVSDSQGRDNIVDAEMAMDKDGRFLGMRVTTIANMGAYLSNFATYIPTHSGTPMLQGVYTTPAIHATVYGVFTNTVPMDAYRGAGRPENIYIIERMVDAAARDIGMDQAEIRRRNFIPHEAMPYKTAMDYVYDSGAFHANLETALDRFDYDGFAGRQEAAAKTGKLLGRGVAYYIEACGAGAGDYVEVHAEADGTVTVYIGNQSNGQGHETVYATLVANRLDIDIERVRVKQGDSTQIPRGGGTGGSRALAEGGAACVNAANGLIERGKLVAGDLLEAAAADIEYSEGVFRVAGTDKSVGLDKVAVEARSREPDADQLPGLAIANLHRNQQKTFPNGAHVCEVEVDRETGTTRLTRYVVVDDFGTVINPLLTFGQVHGGIAQGLGQALMENCVYDPETGQLLSGSFMDYAMPRADDVPQLQIELNENEPCRTNPLGVKGAGEAGCIGAPPAVMNAVLDALSQVGVKHIDMPATPERVWRAMAGAA